MGNGDSLDWTVKSVHAQFYRIKIVSIKLLKWNELFRRFRLFVCARALVFVLYITLLYFIKSPVSFSFFSFGFVVHSNFPWILSRHPQHIFMKLLKNKTDQWTKFHFFFFRYIAQRIPFYHGICCTLCIDYRLLCSYFLHCTKDSITFAWQLRKYAGKFDALPDGTDTK